jgi:hypothetical protein
MNYWLANAIDFHPCEDAAADLSTDVDLDISASRKLLGEHKGPTKSGTGCGEDRP